MQSNVRCLWYNEWMDGVYPGYGLESAMDMIFDRTWMGLGHILG